MWFGFFSNLLWGICFISSILFLKRWGAIGISFAYLFAYFITTIIFIPFYIKKNIVDKEYFFNKNILFIWTMYITYIIICIYTNNIFIKAILFSIMMCVVYWGCEKFFGITKSIKMIWNTKIRK